MQSNLIGYAEKFKVTKTGKFRSEGEGITIKREPDSAMRTSINSRPGLLLMTDIQGCDGHSFIYLFYLTEFSKTSVTSAASVFYLIKIFSCFLQSKLQLHPLEAIYRASRSLCCVELKSLFLHLPIMKSSWYFYFLLNTLLLFESRRIMKINKCKWVFMLIYILTKVKTLMSVKT